MKTPFTIFFMVSTCSAYSQILDGLMLGQELTLEDLVETVGKDRILTDRANYVVGDNLKYRNNDGHEVSVSFYPQTSKIFSIGVHEVSTNEGMDYLQSVAYSKATGFIAKPPKENYASGRYLEEGIEFALVFKHPTTYSLVYTQFGVKSSGGSRQIRIGILALVSRDVTGEYTPRGEVLYSNHR